MFQATEPLFLSGGDGICQSRSNAAEIGVEAFNPRIIKSPALNRNLSFAFVGLPKQAFTC